MRTAKSTEYRPYLLSAVPKPLNPSEMEEIKAYRLSNGEVVSDKEEATKRQRAINFEEAVCRFAEKHGYFEGKGQIRDAILQNADELLDILNKR